MSKLLTTIEALESALSDTPNTPTAWVPLRRATVEAAYRVLGSIPVAISILNVLDEIGEVPNWRAEEANGGQPVFVADEVRVTGEKITTVRGTPVNGAITVASPNPHTNGHSPAPALIDDKPTNTWRRLPKAERLTLACAEIARIAGGRTWVTQAEFDRSKPAAMPTANSLVPTLGLTWIELVCKALPAAVVPAAQPSKRKAKEPAAPAAEPFRAAAQA